MQKRRAKSLENYTRYIVRAIVTMPQWQNVVYDISISVTFNGLEWPVTKISRAGHYSTLNTSETIQYGDIVTMEY